MALPTYPTPLDLQNTSRDASTLRKFSNDEAGVPNVNRAGNDVQNMMTLRRRMLDAAEDVANRRSYVLLSQMMADTSQPVGTPARVEIDPGAGDYTMTEGGWALSDVQPASRAAVDVIDGKAGRATGEAYASRNAVAYPYRRRDRQDPVWQRVTRSGRVVAFADADGGYQSLMPRGQVGRRAVSYPYRSRTNKTSYTLVDRSGRVVVGAPAVIVPTVPVPLSYGQVHVSCEPVNRTFRMVWQHGPNQMMRVDLQPNGFNGLFNFRGAYIAPFGDIGTADWQTVVVTGSDMFPPMIIQAVNNGDGGGLIYTGGNHGSNGAAGGAQTARMTEFSAWIGGRRLQGTEDPFEVYVDTWRARWINELMAYNTILEPRYVCRQVFDAAFHAGGFSYFNGTTGLEAFYVRADNGPQLFQNGYETVHYYDGVEQARTTIAASTTPGASVQYPSWAMVFAGSLAGLHGTWMDRTFEAGDGRYVRGSAGFYRNGNNGKSYSAVAAGGGEPYPTIAAGQTYEYHAGVFWAPANDDGPLDSAWTHYRRGRLHLARAFTEAGEARIQVPQSVAGRDVAGIGVAGAMGLKASAPGYTTSFNLVE